MATFQLWSRDEYGQGQIHLSSEKVEDLVKAAKAKINDINVNNALTIDDKKKNWEEFFVEPQTTDGSIVIYGGLDTTGSHAIYKVAGNDVIHGRLGDGLVRCYLGDLDGTPWYATDPRGNEITKLDHMDLQGKLVYFIKKLQ